MSGPVWPANVWRGGSGSRFVGREMGWFSRRDYSEEAARIDAEGSSAF